MRLHFSKNFSRVIFELLHSGSDLTDKLIFYMTALYCKLKRNTKMIPNQNIHVSQFSITTEIIMMRERKRFISAHGFKIFHLQRFNSMTWVWNRGDLFTLWWAEDKDRRRSLSFIINFKGSVLHCLPWFPPLKDSATFYRLVLNLCRWTFEEMVFQITTCVYEDYKTKIHWGNGHISERKVMRGKSQGEMTEIDQWKKTGDMGMCID